MPKKFPKISWSSGSRKIRLTHFSDAKIWSETFLEDENVSAFVFGCNRNTFEVQSFDGRWSLPEMGSGLKFACKSCELWVNWIYKNMLKHLLQDSSFEILGTPMTRQPTEPLQVLLWHESNSNHKCMGIGCGSVGRAVTSDTRDPRFESQHWQSFIYQL